MNMSHSRSIGSLIGICLCVLGLSACSDDDEPANQAPTVNAGADFDANENTEATLAATAEDDGAELTIAWTQAAGPEVALNATDAPSVTFMAPEVTEDTVLTFQVTVTDTEGETASDTVDVTVKQVNVAPEAVATGPEGMQDELSTVMLDASASTDHDDDQLTYAWEQISGPTATLTNGDTAKASVELPRISVEEHFVFEVTVSDGALEDTATVMFSAREMNRVVFTGAFDSPEFSAGIWSVALPNGERVSLTDERGDVWPVAISPDRRHVAFGMDIDGADASASYSVYVAEIGVENSAQLLFDAPNTFDDTMARDGVGDGTIEWLEWSPNGDTLAFVARQNGLGKAGWSSVSNLYVWSQGKEPANLTGLTFIDKDGSDVADVNLVTDAMAVQWAPDSSRIAYMLDSESRINPAGKILHLYTIEPAADAVAIDVSQQAFALDLLSNEEMYNNNAIFTNKDAIGNKTDDEFLYRMSLPDSDVDFDGVPDGSVKVPGWQETSFGWSADGRLFFIAATGHVGVNDLHVVDGDGSNYQAMTAIASTVGNKNCAATDANRDCIADGDVYSAKWSPDGSLLAYRAALSLDSRAAGLLKREWIVDSHGVFPVDELVMDSRNPDVVSGGQYFWSPDGDKLVLMTAPSWGTSGTLHAFHVESKNMVDLIGGESPSVLRFIGWKSNDILLAEMNPGLIPPQPLLVAADGSGLEAVVDSGVDLLGGGYELSPDGEHLSFGWYDEVNNEYDFAMSGTAQGSTPVPVDDAADYNFWGAWTPDGEYFVGSNWDNDAFTSSLQLATKDGSTSRSGITGSAITDNNGVWEFYVIGPPPVVVIE